MKFWSFVRRVPFAALIAIFFCVLVGVRVQMMWGYSALFDCDGCLVIPSLLSEAQLLLGLVCADLAARRWLGRGAWAVRVLVLCCLLIWLLDAWVRANFHVRLDWREVRKFWQELGSAEFFLRVFLSQGLAKLMLSVLGVVAALWAALGYLRQQRIREPAWLLPLTGLLLALILLAAPERHYHHMNLRNALEAFVDPPTLYREYSADWVEQQRPRLRAAVAASRTCTAQASVDPKPTQIVLVVVESLSNYQSQAFGGIRDWTPQLDRWASKGRRFAHFLANGKTTEDGLFALLTGRPPLLQSGRKTVYESDLEVSRPTLPHVLEQAGYAAAFMTTGNLAFMQKGAWLERVGFPIISGHDAPFYDGMPRYQFDAPEDAALYGHARQWMQAQVQPYLLVLETVSTHQPFFDPVEKKPSIEGAFRYADAALGDFLEQLEREGFFDNGLVIVTGDHRAMVPATVQERQQMGENHLSRVPLLLLGASAGIGEESGYFSQQDLLPSLQQLLLPGETCLYPGQSLWGAGPGAVPAECVFTNRAPHPDREFLQCGEQTYELRLDAQDTHYVGKAGPEAYLDAVHAQRVPELMRPPVAASRQP